MKTGLDAVTKRVLLHFAAQADGDLDEAARRAGCTTEVARARLQRLRANGVLRGVRLDLDPARLGRPHEVLVTGAPTAATDREALEGLCRADGVTRVFTLASRSSVAFTVRGRDPDNLVARGQELAEDAGLAQARCTLMVQTLHDDPLAGVRDLLPEAPLPAVGAPS